MPIRNKNMTLDAAQRKFMSTTSIDHDIDAATLIIPGTLDPDRDLHIQGMAFYLSEAVTTAGLDIDVGYLGNAVDAADAAAGYVENWTPGTAVRTTDKILANETVGGVLPIVHKAGRILTVTHTEVTTATGKGYFSVIGTWEDTGIVRAKVS